MCKFAIITRTYIAFLPFQADYFFGENTGGSGMYKRIIRFVHDFVHSIMSIQVMSDFDMSTWRAICYSIKGKDQGLEQVFHTYWSSCCWSSWPRGFGELPTNPSPHSWVQKVTTPQKWQTSKCTCYSKMSQVLKANPESSNLPPPSSRK